MAYLSALYLYNSESGFNKEIEKSSEITLIAPSIDKYSVKQELKKKHNDICVSKRDWRKVDIIIIPAPESNFWATENEMKKIKNT